MLVYTDMDTHARDVVERYYAAFGARRNEWQDLVTDDVVFDGPVQHARGQGRVRRPDDAVSERAPRHTTVAASRRRKHGHVDVKFVIEAPNGQRLTCPVAKWAIVSDGR